MSFVHLHVHTEQSLLDGLSKADELISAAYQDGQPAVACTDHGSLGMTRQLVTAAHRLHQRLIEHGDLPADSDLPVKPILGIEAYLSIGSRHERNFTVVKTDELAVEDSEGKSVHGTKQKRYDHLTLLAVNTAGWRNLLRLHRASYESFWYKPRMDFELLAEHSEGIIALSGCLGGPVAGPLSRGEGDIAAANLDRLIDIFGHDNVYVELMDHGIGIERNIVVDLIALADERDLPIVASNDCHYTHCDDAEAHDAWLALQSGRWSSARLDDPKRFRFNGSGYHLRTEAEMRSLFDDADPRDFCLDDEGMDVLRQRWDEACDTTVELADRIAFDAMPEPTQRLPRFPVPQSFTVPAHRGHAIKHPVIDGRLDTSTDVALTDADHYLYRLVQLGAAQRWGYSDGTGRTRLPDNVKARLREEFDIVAGMGFSDYFLIVADLVSWARDNGIAVGPGRGSSAGSAMSYALGIVGVDPLRYHLLFERFLEPGRVGMPDIDIDFEKARRDEVIAYLASRWGADTVAKIGTYGVSLSRRSFQSAARLLDRIDLGELSKTIPIHGGKPASLQAVTDETDPDGEEFRRAVADLDAEDQEAVKQILDLAGPMEGAVMDSGIHACGILIADQPLVDIVPLRLDTRSKAGSGRDGYPVTEWDCNEVEAYGLLKMDVLGLRTLDILTEACRTVSTQTGTDIDPTTIPDPDDSSDPRVKAAWSLISDARTAGVFQLEGSGMAEVCEQIRPSNLEELAAVVALYRPGPIAARMPQLYADRKWGRAEVDYSHYTDDPAEQKAIAGVLDETQGCLIYQEQLMRLSRTVAGFDAVWRSKLRKAVGKKKAEIMAEVGEKFLADAVTEMTLDDGTHKPAFSRACAEALWEDFKGSASYSFNASHAVAYAQLAYMTAYLKASWPAAYGAALLSMTKDDDKRLAALHSLAAEGVDVAGPDVNLSGEHTAPVTPDQVALGLSEVKGVGAAGAEIVAQRLAGGQYTSLGDLASRCPSVTSAVLAALIEAGACDAFGPRRGLFMAHRAAKKCPQVPVSDSEWPAIERGRRQRDVLGLVVAAEHPMRQLGDFLRQWKTERSMSSHTPLSRVHELDNGESVNVFGIVRSWQQRVSKAGNLYARFVLENASTSVEGIVFASALEPLARQKIAIAAGDLVNLRGRVSIREQFQLPNGHTSDESPDEDGSQAADHVAEVTAEIIVSSAERIDTGEEPSCADPPVDMSALVDLYTDGLDSESPGEEPDDDGDDDSSDDDEDDDEKFEDDNGRFDVSDGLHGSQPPATAPPAAKPSTRLQHPTPAAIRPSPVVMRRENRNAAYRHMSTVTGNAVLLVAGGFEPPALFADGQKCGESSPFAIRWSTRRSAVSPGLTFGADTGEIPPGIHLLTLNLGASAEQVTLIVLDPLTHSWPHSCADALASSDGRLTTAGVAAAATTELMSADSFSVHAGCISTDVHLTDMTAAGTG